MKAHRRKTAPPIDPPAAPPAPQKNRRKAPREPALNRLLAPDARWQRFQRYVWDRKKG